MYRICVATFGFCVGYRLMLAGPTGMACEHVVESLTWKRKFARPDHTPQSENSTTVGLTFRRELCACSGRESRVNLKPNLSFAL